jgi:FlaA1/EpsC-like NDP-sugar epimerase
VEIVFTGLRPGEKLHEELYWQGEGIVPTENKKITMLKPNGLYPEKLCTQLDQLEESSRSGNIQDVYALLKEIVPEAKIGNSA